MKQLVYFLLLTLFLMACSDSFEPVERHYLIPQGEHKSRLVGGMIGDKLRTLKQSELTFVARFDKTARYDLGNENQLDINKLMGVSEANQFHQQNSIRFGWRYLKESDGIEILAYAYQNGQMSYESITVVPIDYPVVYTLGIREDAFQLQVRDSKMVEVKRAEGNKVGIYYLLYPYFGGNESAPHDINIYIQEIF